MSSEALQMGFKSLTRRSEDILVGFEHLSEGQNKTTEDMLRLLNVMSEMRRSIDDMLKLQGSISGTYQNAEKTMSSRTPYEYDFQEYKSPRKNVPKIKITAHEPYPEFAHETNLEIEVELDSELKTEINLEQESEHKPESEQEFEWIPVLKEGASTEQINTVVLMEETLPEEITEMAENISVKEDFDDKRAVDENSSETVTALTLSPMVAISSEKLGEPSNVEKTQRPADDRKVSEEEIQQLIIGNAEENPTEDIAAEEASSNEPCTEIPAKEFAVKEETFHEDEGELVFVEDEAVRKEPSNLHEEDLLPTIDVEELDTVILEDDEAELAILEAEEAELARLEAEAEIADLEAEEAELARLEAEEAELDRLEGELAIQAAEEEAEQKAAEEKANKVKFYPPKKLPGKLNLGGGKRVVFK